jgi:hypothetical protein
MTLEELIATYERIVENRSNEMEFSAKLAGAEFKKTVAPSSSSSNSQDGSVPKQSLAERLRSRVDSDRVKGASENKKTNFAEGIGYQVIN